MGSFESDEPEETEGQGEQHRQLVRRSDTFDFQSQNNNEMRIRDCIDEGEFKDLYMNVLFCGLAEMLGICGCDKDCDEDDHHNNKIKDDVGNENSKRLGETAVDDSGIC